MKRRVFPSRITGLLAAAMMTAGSALAAEDVFDNMISRSAVEGGFRLFAEGKAVCRVCGEGGCDYKCCCKYFHRLIIPFWLISQQEQMKKVAFGGWLVCGCKALTEFGKLHA